MRRTALLALSISILLLGSGNCLNGFQQDHRSMQCCAQMPCSHTNHDHSCCKDVVSSTERCYHPAPQFAVNAPAHVTLGTIPALLFNAALVTAERASLHLSWHPPPGGLYTLHQSFLI